MPEPIIDNPAVTITGGRCTSDVAADINIINTKVAGVLPAGSSEQVEATLNAFLESARKGGEFSQFSRWMAMRLGLSLTEDEGHLAYAMKEIASRLMTSSNPHWAGAARSVADTLADPAPPAECIVRVTMSTVYDDKLGRVTNALYDLGGTERDEWSVVEMVGIPANKAAEVRDTILRICDEEDQVPGFLEIEIYTLSRNGVVGDSLL